LRAKVAIVARAIDGVNCNNNTRLSRRIGKY